MRYSHKCNSLPDNEPLKLSIIRFVIFILLSFALPSQAFISSLTNFSVTLPRGKLMTIRALGNTFYCPYLSSLEWFGSVPKAVGEQHIFPATEFNAPYPDALMPLLGISQNSFCTSQSLWDKLCPCAYMGFYADGAHPHWIAPDVRTKNMSKMYLNSTLLPFQCSTDHPCNISTPDPADGIVGGCDRDLAVLSDTLVVVTWNRTRYLFRPLRYIAGTGGIYAVPTDWPPSNGASGYDAGLYFGPIPSTVSRTVCALNLIGVNGTVGTFSVDDDDPSSPTGLRLIAKVVPPVLTSPICRPTVQYLVPPPFIAAGTILSVTCASGDGWLWDLAQDLAPTLVGNFSITPPPAAVTERLLVVDITIILVQPTSCGRTGLLTTIALLSKGVLESVETEPTDRENTELLSFASFISKPTDAAPYWFTDRQISNSTSQGWLNISGEAQPLRNGIGWVLPTTMPASIHDIGFSQCDEVITRTLSWLGENALYAAVTSDYLILIDPINGTLAQPRPFDVVDCINMVGGATFSGPIRLAKGSKSFMRLPSSIGGTNALLQTFLDNSPTAYFLRSTSGGLLSPFITILNSSMQHWCWVPDEPIFYYTPSPISLKITLPTSSNLIQLQWVNEFPVFYSTDLATNTSAFFVGASARDIPLSAGVSWPLAASNNSPYWGLSSLNVQYSPVIFACHGNTVSAYDSSFGIEVWSFNQLSKAFLCQTESCGCSTDSALYVSQDRLYVVVIFKDYIDQTSGIVVLNAATGFLEASLPTGATQRSDLIKSECGPLQKFGTLVDISSLISSVGFIAPIVGSRCMFVMYFFNEEGTGSFFSWGISVATGEPVSFTAAATVEGSFIIIAESPSFKASSFGGKVFGFDIDIMMSALYSNPSNVLYGSNPTFVIENATSYVVVNDLIVVVHFLNITNSSEGRFDFMIEFILYDSHTGAFTWSTDMIAIPEFQHAQKSPAILEVFTTVQTEESGVITWACVGVYKLVCIGVTPTLSPVLLFPWAKECYGPPAITLNRFLIWASEGLPPFSIPLNEEDIGWMGLSYSSPPFPFNVNQTSCSNALLANEGLLMHCSLEGSDEKRLFLVNSETGSIIYGLGPLVEPNMFVMSLDGERISFVETDLMNAITITLQTTLKPAKAPINAIVCHADIEYHYVLSFGEGSVNATRTPIDDYQGALFESFAANISTYELYAFSDAVSFDSLRTLFGAVDMINALRPALDPLVIDLLESAQIYLAALEPTYLGNANGEHIMSATECEDCSLNCPYFCVLDIETGDQILYTAHPRSIDALRKARGHEGFDPFNVTVFPIRYSGSVSLNLHRFSSYQLPSSQQPIMCSNQSNTTLAPSGRYCLLSAMSNSWSVIEIAEGSPSFAVTYTTLPSVGRYTTHTISRHYGYMVWTSGEVLAVANQLGLSLFLSRQPRALPPKVGSSNIETGNVTDVVLDEDELIVKALGGNLTYTTSACSSTVNVTETLPMCPSTFTSFSRALVDESIVTIVWEGTTGSNWGIGFVAVGYQVTFNQILRYIGPTDAPITCSTIENKNPSCTVVCQPTIDCVSQFHSTFTSFLSLQSWLPKGSTLVEGGPCGQQSTSPVDFTLRFYGTKNGDVIITSTVGDDEVILFSSGQYEPQVFGVSFTFSHCAFYTLSHIVAQPFGWLAICAVKSLLVTFGFYLLEHRIRGRERQRDALRDRVARLESEIADIRKAQKVQRGARETELLPKEASEAAFHGNKDESATGVQQRQTWQAATSAEYNSNSAQLKGLEEELFRCSEENQRIKSCGGSRSLIDRFSLFLIWLCSFGLQSEVTAHTQRVRSNLLPKDFDENSLVDLLLFVFKEDRRYVAHVRSFAAYYEKHMCNNQSWVVRQHPLAYFGSTRVTALMTEQLDSVHYTLKEAYKCFKRLNTRSISFKEGEPTFSPTDSSPLLYFPASENSSSCLTKEKDVAGQEEFSRLVNAFNRLHHTEPNSFEYAILNCRRTDAQLQPSGILLLLSLLQSIATVFMYALDIYIRSWTTPITPLQLYECTCFMIFNSSLPSSLLVNAVFHADLSSANQSTSFKAWARYVFKSPFVIASLLLLAPPLITHVIPGLFLYCWLLLPPVGLVIFVEYRLRRIVRRSNLLVATRVVSRVAILLLISIVFSIAFNAADGYIWKWFRGEESFITGTYTPQHYFGAVVQDYDARSLSCVWEHLFATISNFLQMGFFLV